LLIMQAARRAWMAPVLCCLLAVTVYVVAGDGVGVGIAIWFCWCMTRADDDDHQWLRYLGWVMLVTIGSLIVGRLALAA
jgi:hypothetical protein